MTLNDAMTILSFILSFFLGRWLFKAAFKSGVQSVLNRLEIVKLSAFIQWINTEDELADKFHSGELIQIDFENAIREMNKDFFDRFKCDYANKQFHLFSTLVNVIPTLESQCLR